MVYRVRWPGYDPSQPVSHSAVDPQTGVLSGGEVLVDHGETGVIQERPDGLDTGAVVQFKRGWAYVNEAYLVPWVPNMRDLPAVEHWLST